MDFYAALLLEWWLQLQYIKVLLDLGVAHSSSFANVKYDRPVAWGVGIGGDCSRAPFPVIKSVVLCSACTQVLRLLV